MLIGITNPILKNALLQPTFRSVFQFLSLPLFCPADSAAATNQSTKTWGVREGKDQPNKSDDDKIHVL